MIRSCVAAVLAVALAAHDGAATECAPIQFFGNTWMSGSEESFETAELENYIGAEFLNHGATLYDAKTSKEHGNYFRFEIWIHEVSCTNPPGELGECDLEVAVYDWQGARLRSVSGPPYEVPCDAPTLIHSKVWHVSNAASYSAAATYYYQNRDNYPAVFASVAPALSPLGLGLTGSLLVLVALLALRRRSDPQQAP